jgi:hypothetical protein
MPLARLALCALAAACNFMLAAPAAAAPGAALAAVALSSEAASADALYAAQWILESADHAGRPFAIVDKKDARLFVFDRDGALLGATPALLGFAPGDHSVPGIGEREPSQILPAEQTTPSGRFDSEPGRNLRGEDVVWIDYEAGLAIHRLRPGYSQEGRAQRLATPTPADNRASLGCVVVPVAFYEGVVAPALGHSRGVVYVLPETQPVSALLGGYRVGLLRP